MMYLRGGSGVWAHVRDPGKWGQDEKGDSSKPGWREEWVCEVGESTEHPRLWALRALRALRVRERAVGATNSTKGWTVRPNVHRE